VSEIVKQMRKDKKPYLLEALTYRYKGHSVSDPGLYRSKDEVKDYMENNDPIKNLSAIILKEKFATEEELKGWDKEAKELSKAAEKFGEESPEPEISERFTDVLAD
jgi:pyruvate dehydrogenase E1 component alpha subunit